MALLYDGIDDYTLVADDAALALGDAEPNSGPWAHALWFQKGVMDDTSPHYLESWGAFGATPSLSVFIYGEAAGSYTNELRARIRDGETGQAYLTPIAVVADYDWHHLLLHFDGTTFTTYLDGVLKTTTSLSAWGVIDVAGDWHLGRRSDAASGYFKGQLAEPATWGRALSSDERAALAAGAPAVLFPAGLVWSLPMRAGARAEYGGLSVTDYSSGPIEHPPKLFYPGRPKVILAARGVRPRSVFRSSVFYSPVVA